MQRWTSKALSFASDPTAPFARADLEIIGLETRVPSFAALVYFNHPRVKESAGAEAHGYAGSFAFFGHGEECWGDEGHCDITEAITPFDKRAEPLLPANVTIDVTDALRALGGNLEVRVTILAKPVGKTRSKNPLRFAQLMLVTYT